jgi:hypothetical protein
MKTYDTVGQIMAYEQGELDGDEAVELFQRLLDSGLVWKLQGAYGRVATRLIKQGIIVRKEKAHA